MKSPKSSRLLLPFIAVMGIGVSVSTSAVQAGYAVLNGAPVTQGQMRISEDDVERLQARKPSTTNRFILKETRVDVEISGVLARVRVAQVFQNPYAERLEALYVFPLPENAAVDGYSFQIGERVIRGVVKTREEARKAYEQARDEGRKAALLEQERPNIFSQSVANIPPNAEITVHIEYVHPVDIDGDHYIFRFPMVVAPRYIPGSPLSRPNVGRGWARDTTQVPDASRITPQHMAPGMRNGNDVFITVRLDAGMPIQEILAVTHELNLSKTSETQAQISLKNQSTIADKDFVLEYRLAGSDTVLASLTHRGEKDKDGYLTLVLQPKWNIEEVELAAREVVLMLDTSGSMNGPAISQLRIFAQHVLDNLHSQDHFRIVAFSSSPRAFQPSAVSATPQNIEAAKQFVRGLHAGGGTEMLSALRMALESGRSEQNRPRYLFILTDALVGNDNSILGYLKDPQFADARVFPIAFGAAPNHFLISRAAELGRGFAMQVTNQDNPAELAQRFNEKTSAPYMTDLEIDWGNLVIKDLIPARLPDLYAGRPLVIMGRYDKPGSSEVTLKGNVLGQAVQMAMKLELPEREDEHDSLGTLWARQRIRQIWNRDLGQPTSEGRVEITRLGLTHQLLTQYTSFVAVEEEAPEKVEGTLRRETVPTMLPEGMTEAPDGRRQPRRMPPVRPSRPIAQNTASQSRPYVPNNPTPPQPASAVRRPSGGGGGGGFGGGGAVEWVFLASVGLLCAGRLMNRRRKRRNPGNDSDKASIAR
ncbi:MAG: VWA domain-containing protein [Planctomycetes bacterium]|nr:VWA domain-containing protein [Planctomycetota bacterium]